MIQKIPKKFKEKRNSIRKNNKNEEKWIKKWKINKLRKKKNKEI